MTEIIQWLVRDKNGEIKGPLTTVEVVRKIRAGKYYGEEYISRYPSGRWHPISYDESFFNILLEVLEEELSPDEEMDPQKKEEVTQRIEIIKKEFNDAKTIVAPPSEGRAVFEDLDANTPVIIDMEPEPSGPKTPPAQKMGRAVADKKTTSKKTEKKTNPRKVRSPRRARRAQTQFLIAFAVIGVVLTVYFFIQPSDHSGDRIQLRTPHYGNSKKINSNEIARGMKRAIEAFRQDSFKGYLTAQDALVEIVESSGSLDAYSFLCMTYRELWPFSYQDSKDQETLQNVLRRVQKINPKSASANVCLVVSYWVKGRYDDALRVMDNHLQQSPGLIFFNQMTGDIYAARQDYRSASYYFSKVRELWRPLPVWSKALLQEARMYRKSGAHGTAVKLYRRLLNENPSHAVAKIELGIVEFSPYQNISKAKDYIRAGLSADQPVPKMIEAEAYVTLAKISILQGNNSQALKLSKKAFSVDSSNQESRELIVSMGGIKALNTVSIDNINMVYLGEQYMKMNNHTAAQAEFRAAFEANPRNGFAALRAGEALWELNQSNEAISWIKKSITADPGIIRSYLILADYQSARYDYVNAIETLKSALRVNPRHHGLYRGFALIELRRRNYEGAVRFAKKAIELYDTDIESLIVLAQALNENGNPEEAFQYIQQALELDSSNEDVHIIFAHILAKLQGTQAGTNYLDAMISKYGKSTYLRALGELLAAEERYTEATKYYFDALAKDPKDKKTLMALAKILQSQKDYDRARDFLLEAATIDPSDAEPLFLIGQLYLDSGKNDFALKQFERVISVNPNYPLAYYYAGQAHIALGNADEALKMAQQEGLINPEIPEPYLLAAEAYFKKKQFSLCADEYQKVLAKGLHKADIYIQLARCYRLYGAFDSASTMLDRAEGLESGNPNIYKELGALYHEKGSYIKALEFYKRYLQLSPHGEDKEAIEAEISKIENRKE